MDNELLLIIIIAFFLLFAMYIIAYPKNIHTKEELIQIAKNRFQKNINIYRVDLPISKEDPFKSSKYSSQKILKARERIAEIKKYWKENKEKLKEMPFMTDELYESTDKELNN